MKAIKVNEENFERGGIKKTLDIGEIKLARDLVGEIDSNDLEMYAAYEDYESEEEFIEEWADEDPEYRKRFINNELVKIHLIKKFLDKDIKFGEFFDYKEESKMRHYIQKNSRGRYVYNAYPGGDGWYVVFSTLYLPKAEQIDF